MLRVSHVYALAFATLVTLLWAARGLWAPEWPLVAAWAGAFAYVLLTRDARVSGALRPPSLAVLIPTKDNVATVGDVARRAAAHGMPVYVVDDGSTDGSGAACADVARVLTHPVNQGKGRALLTGMRAARADGHTHVLCLDADGQHDPDDLPAFRDAVLAEPEAIFVGVRDLSTAPGRSQFGRKFSNFWIWVETGWRVGDSQCGFRAYPIVPVLSLPLGGSRYDLEVEVLTRALWGGTPVRDLPCRVYYPPVEERVTSFRPIVDNARISWMNTRLVFGRLLWPARWRVRIRPASAWDARSRGFAAGWHWLLWAVGTLGPRPAYVGGALTAAWYRAFETTPGIRAWSDANGGISIFRLYRNFSVALLDRLLYLLRGPDAFQYARDGGEHLVGAFDAPGGAVLLTSHFGNIEVAAGAGTSPDRMRRLAVVRFDAEVDHGRDLLEKLPDTWRPRFISVNRSDGFAALTILRELRAGSVVAVQGDRLVDDRSVTVQFYGRPMRVPAGPYLLAAIAQVPVVMAFCVREGHLRYRTFASPPRLLRFDRTRPREEQLRAWAQEYADTLEALTRRWPEQWFNFHDPWSA